MRRTGIETGGYFGLTGAEKGFTLMKKHGYDCADYQNFVDTETELFTVGDAEFEKRVLADAEAAKSAGIEIYQAHGPWRWPPQDATPQDRAERMEKMKKSVWGTSLLGCKYMVIHPIMPYGDNADPEPEKYWQMNLEFWNELLRTAKQYSVTLCLENMPMPRLCSSTPEATLRMINDLHDENMAFCLDTGHCAMLGLSPADAVRLAGKMLKTVHIHDNNGVNDLHWMPYHDRGAIDWEAFRIAMRETVPEVPLSLETSYGGNIPAVALEDFQIGLAKLARHLAE